MGGLVGREQEWRRLVDAIAGVESGVPAIVVLEGDGGIGKTRLADAAAAEAAARGFRVLRGRADDIPHESLAPVLELWASEPEGATLRGLLGDSPRAGADRGTMTGADDRASLVAHQAADVVIDGLERLARSTFVLVDDLHWADDATIACLRSTTSQLAGLPVLVILALRPSPRSRALAALLRRLDDAGAERLRLGPLDDAAVAALLTERLGTTPSADVLARLSAAAGNPFLTVELARALDHWSSDGSDTGTGELPAAVRASILSRFAGLGAEIQDALRLAAVLGSRISLDDLALATGRSVVDLAMGLRIAVDAGVLADCDGQLGFAHDLVRQALYEDLPAAVRRSLHRDVGRRLVAAGAPLESTAAHVSLGAEPGDAEAAAWLAEAAGTLAERSTTLAIELAERALQLAPADAFNERAATLLVSLLYRSGRSKEGEELGLRFLERVTDPAAVAWIRYGIASAYLNQTRLPQAASWYEAILHDDTTPAEARVWTRTGLASTRLWMGDQEGAAREAEAAVADANEVGLDDPSVAAALAAGLIVAAGVHLMRGEVTTAVETSRRGAEVGRIASGFAGNGAYAPESVGTALVDADRFDEAIAELSGGRAVAERTGVLHQVPSYCFALATAHFAAGDWDAALFEIEAGARTPADFENAHGLVIGFGITAIIQHERGDGASSATLAEARRHLDANGPSYGMPWLLLAEVLAAGDPAPELLHRLWRAQLRMGYTSSYRTVVFDLTRLAVGAGDLDLARTVAEHAEEGAGRSEVPSALAIAVACRGEATGSVELLAEALAAMPADGRPYERGRIAEAVGLRSARAGFPSEAIAALERADATWDRLGAARARSRVAGELRKLGVRRGARAPRARPTSGWEALTPAELDVVRRVARGMTNRQIAEDLFVARSTVHTHLLHVFAKLGCTSRAQVATECARREGSG
jgi:DNA-binding CsgD family transcriptional regulator/tetratricopeptide (TPR) repeat protein